MGRRTSVVSWAIHATEHMSHHSESSADHSPEGFSFRVGGGRRSRNAEEAESGSGADGPNDSPRASGGGSLAAESLAAEEASNNGFKRSCRSDRRDSEISDSHK